MDVLEAIIGFINHYVAPFATVLSIFTFIYSIRISKAVIKLRQREMLILNLSEITERIDKQIAKCCTGSTSDFSPAELINLLSEIASNYRCQLSKINKGRISGLTDTLINCEDITPNFLYALIPQLHEIKDYLREDALK